MRALIDTHAFLGSWPFSLSPALTAAQLAAHLACNGIRRALVSHLGAVFQPDPMPANRALFAALRRMPALVPVPILNPALATWRDHLNRCSAAAMPLRAVLILPNYHRYALTSRRLDIFMSALAEARVKLILNVRFEDERHTYFALRIKGVTVDAIATFLRRFPQHHVLCAGLYHSEIERLAAQCKNFSADISFAEAMTTLESLRDKIPAQRLMYGSCAPLLSVPAQVAKIRHARLPARQLGLVASENARRFFAL